MIKRNNRDILSISDNKRIRYPSRIYDGLFDFNGASKGLGWDNQSKLKAKEAFSEDNTLSSLGSIGGTLGTFANSFKENASVKDMSGQKALIEDAGNTQFSTDDYDSLMNQWNNINWQSADYRAKDLKGVSTGQQIGNVVKSTLSGASTGAKIGGIWGAALGAIGGAGVSSWGIFSGKSKAKGLANSLNAMATLANSDNIEQYNRAMMMANNNIYDNLYGNFAAYGGNLNMDIPNYQTHGGDFFNGVTKINEGGTHEENPNGGIIMGIDEKGVPNLVEEGEVIYNDYVYSNRLTPNDKMLEKFNFPSKYRGKTFAYIAEDLSKESEETPLDPINKRGLQANMSKLSVIQELVRDSMGKTGENRLVKANGGRIYSGDRDIKKTLKSLYDINQNYLDSTLANTKDNPIVLKDINYEGEREFYYPEEYSPNTSKNKPLPTNMRYASIAISGMAALNSLLSKPDYENANIIRDAAKNIPYSVIPFNKIYNNYSYRPIDTDYILNQVKAQAGATNRAILNSNLNAGSAMAGLLSSGYNTQRAIGNALMQAENINDARRKEAAQMQTAVDQYNSQGLTNVAKANADLSFNRAKMENTLLSNYATMREGIDNALEQSRSANLTNFADNLGNLGRENVNWNWLQGLKDSGYFNRLNESMDYDKEGRRISKYGGKIRKRR